MTHVEPKKNKLNKNVDKKSSKLTDERKSRSYLENEILSVFYKMVSLRI